ncbi:hypothetical protein B0H12DRAFT_339948 [Mycena haematopus]|nr:hypothetical protein B0H12DRAFT_339948 [Mycena haematopus]
MPSSFPQEIIDEILDYLAQDFRSLRVCSLAYPHMVARSRLHLFKVCHLSARRLLALRDLLRSPGCTFIPYIRSIEAYRCSGEKEDRYFEEVAEELRRLTNVRVLDVIFNVAVDASNVDDYLLGGFLAAFPHITRLSILCGFGPSSFPVPLIGTLCMFPALEVLQLRDTSTWVVKEPPTGAIPPKKLRSVALTMDTNGPIMAWMHDTGHLSNVNTVQLSLLKAPQGPAVRAALQQLGGVLHYLEIEVTWTPGNYWAPASAVFDLALHPNLKTLVISDHSDLSYFDPNQMTRLITRLTGPALERLSLSVYSRQYQNLLMWAALDAFLCSPRRFPHLRTVALRCNRGHPCDKFFRAALPLLKAAGVVTTDRSVKFVPE